MSIARQLSNAGLFVIEDSRAKYRKFDTPFSLPLSYIDNLDTLETIEQVASNYPTALALVLQTGQVIVLTESGKGGIAIQGLEQQMTEPQSASLAIVVKVLNAEFNLTPKKTSRKSATTTAPEPTDGDLSVSEATEASVEPEASQEVLEADSEANGAE